jgi:hypothetical protein
LVPGTAERGLGGKAVKYEPYNNHLGRWVIRSLSPIKNPETDEVINVSAIVKDITERKKMEETLRQRTSELGKRVKELNCLFAISSLVEKPGITLEEILQGTVELIPLALRYQKSTCARITLDGQEFCTKNWMETANKQISEIVVNGERIGALEIDRLENTPKSEETSFLKKENSLLDAVTERVGKIIARNLVEAEKKTLENQLRDSANTDVPGLVLRFGSDLSVLIEQNHRHSRAKSRIL